MNSEAPADPTDQDGEVGEVVRFDVVRHGDDATVVHVVGEIDTLTAPVLRAQLDEHIPVIELTGTQALGLLLSLTSTVLLVRIASRGRGLQEAADDPPSREGALHHADAGQSAADSEASSTPSA